MPNQFFTWKNFTTHFGAEMKSATDVYDNMKRHGLHDFALAIFDFDFETDQASKANELAKFLETHYPYTDMKIQKQGKCWILTGNTNEIPVTEEILMYWALDMYKRGYEHDCRLIGYGATTDQNNVTFPDFNLSKAEEYFEKGLDCYHSGNLSGALVYWTINITINPEAINAYYSRAIVKEELYTWKSALRDYDKAIELAPDFTSAYTNRGALKDENGDYSGAIDDYNKAIELEKEDTDNLQRAYYNRGNSWQHLGDLKAACRDWKTALDLGANYAQATMDEFCRK